MTQHPPPPAARNAPSRSPRWLWALLAATMLGTLATVLALGWGGPDVANMDVAGVDDEAEDTGPASDLAPGQRGGLGLGGRRRIGSASVSAGDGDRDRWVTREQVASHQHSDEAEAPALRLPGQLPPLRDPAREAAARAERALQRDIERARDEAIAIGNQMATDLEQFVAEIQALPRAEQRIHARNVHAHFDWQSADRLAVLRAKLPEDERNALQIVTYKRIEPLIWRLDALAAED